MKTTVSLLALVGASSAAMLNWQGPAISLNSASSWSGITAPNTWPVGGTAPASVTFGSLQGPITAGLTGPLAVGNSLTFSAPFGASIVFQQGASLTFGNAGPAPATFLPATPGFSTPGASPSAEASAFQYNCPLNWVDQTGATPVSPPQSTDQVTIGGQGYYVSTFGQMIAAQTINAFSANSQPALCSGNPQSVTIPGTPGSTLDWGASPQGCPNVFAMGMPAIAPSCGNLVISQLTGRVGGTVVMVYTCPNNAASCGPNGNTALVVNNISGMATGGARIAATVTQTPGGSMVTVPSATDGSVALTPGVAPSVSDPNGASDSSSGVSVLVIIIIIAVVVVVLVAGVLYAKKSKAQPAPAGSAGRGGGFGGVGFENPLYDENPGKAQGGGPQYADAPAEAQQESGYMDVPAEGDGGGYLDVDAEDADEDNF